MALKPLGDRIVVQSVAAEEKTSGGIFLPDSAQEKPQQAKVLAVGPGRVLDNGKLTTMDVKVDDTVYYSKYAATEVKVGGKEYLILRQDDVLAIIE